MLLALLSRADAMRAARRYLDEVRKYYECGGPERGGYAECFRLNGAFAVATGDRAEARANFQRAIAIAESQNANRFRLRACRDRAALH